jgi:hypothetical protein
MGNKKEIVTFRLPEGHPLWMVEKGQRSEAIREMITLGMALSEISTQLENVTEHLSQIDKRLSAIEKNRVASEPPKQSDEDNPNGIVFDVKAIVDAFGAKPK